MTKKIRFLGLILTVTALAVFIMACRNPAGAATEFDIALTVSGTGRIVSAPYSSAAGRMVTIEAERKEDTPNTYEFGKWRVVNGGGETLFTSTSKTATFRMPAEDVTIEAIFVDVSDFITGYDWIDGAPRWSIIWSNAWPLPSTDLILPGSIGGIDIEGIGAGAFDGRLLTSLSIPYGITHIGSSAFGSNYLTHIYIPGSVTYIYDDAFLWNFSLSSVTVTLGDGVQTVGNLAFGHIPNLEKIIILGNGVTLSDSSFAESPPGNYWPCRFYRDHGPTITQPGTFRWNEGTSSWVRQ